MKNEYIEELLEAESESSDLLSMVHLSEPILEAVVPKIDINPNFKKITPSVFRKDIMGFASVANALSKDMKDANLKKEYRQYTNSANLMAKSYEKAFKESDNNGLSNIVCLALIGHLKVMYMGFQIAVIRLRAGQELDSIDFLSLEIGEMNRIANDITKMVDKLKNNKQLQESYFKNRRDTTIASIAINVGVIFLAFKGADFLSTGVRASLVAFSFLHVIATMIIMYYRTMYMAKNVTMNMIDDFDTKDPKLEKIYRDASTKAESKGRIYAQKLLSVMKEEETKLSLTKNTSPMTSSGTRAISSNIPALI